MVDISYLGFELKDEKFDSIEGRRGLLAAPLIPFDGMNEHGLTIGMAAVPDSGQPFDPNKPTFHGLGIIRMMLDKTKSVDEALALFDEYNVVAEGGPQVHYLLADPSGASALVELKDNEKHIFRNDRPWQTATNFYFCGNETNPNRQCPRYAKIARSLAGARGKMNIDQAFGLLKDVAQESTRWSAVFDMSNQQIKLVTERRFDQIHEFKLNQ